MSSNAEEQQSNEKEKNDDEFIRIGGVKLSNKDLREIVQSAESMGSNHNAPEYDEQFMKSLNEYATEKSKEILASTVYCATSKEPVSPAPPKSDEPSDEKKAEELKTEENISEEPVKAASPAPPTTVEEKEQETPKQEESSSEEPAKPASPAPPESIEAAEEKKAEEPKTEENISEETLEADEKKAEETKTEENITEEPVKPASPAPPKSTESNDKKKEEELRTEEATSEEPVKPASPAPPKTVEEKEQETPRQEESSSEEPAKPASPAPPESIEAADEKTAEEPKTEENISEKTLEEPKKEESTSEEPVKAVSPAPPKSVETRDEEKQEEHKKEESTSEEPVKAVSPAPPKSVETRDEEKQEEHKKEESASEEPVRAVSPDLPESVEAAADEKKPEESTSEEPAASPAPVKSVETSDEKKPDELNTGESISKEPVKPVRPAPPKPSEPPKKPAPPPNANAQSKKKNEKPQQTPPKPKNNNNKNNNKNNKKKQEDRLFVDPSGSNTAYYVKPVECDSAEYENVHQKHYKLKSLHETGLEKTALFLKEPLVIAEQLLQSRPGFTFQFQIDFYFGVTGILRQCAFNFIGEDTFHEIYYLFKHKYCESENFQWFYLNHNGKLMEVHDTTTLKHMLIAHGAYPKGIFDTKREVAKVLCIPRCSMTEETIFEREIDLIMGVDNQMLCQQDSDLADNLLYQIAPDGKYMDVFNTAVIYTGEEDARLYNNYDTIDELAKYCQRELDIDSLFDDERNFVISNNDLITLLLNRSRMPYKGFNNLDSMKIELNAVVKRLKQSKHQTTESLRHVEGVLNSNIDQFLSEPVGR